MPFGLTPVHLVIILVVVLIFIGPRGLPKLGSALGKSIREFRQAVPATRDAFTSEVAVPADPVTGTGAAAGSKLGTAAGRSVRGFRDAVSKTASSFQDEISPASAAASSRPEPATGDGPSAPPATTEAPPH